MCTSKSNKKIGKYLFFIEAYFKEGTDSAS